MSRKLSRRERAAKAAKLRRRRYIEPHVRAFESMRAQHGRVWLSCPIGHVYGWSVDYPPRLRICEKCKTLCSIYTPDEDRSGEIGVGTTTADWQRFMRNNGK